MDGTKTLDLTAFITQEAELTMKLDEGISPDNLALALLGDPDTTGLTFELLGLSEVIRAVKLTGTNDFGNKVEVILHKVFFSCDKVIDFIGDDWNDVELTGDILKYNGSFGTIRFLGTPVSPPNVGNYFIGKGNVYTSATLA